MTYISKKTRLLVPRWFNECDPAYLYHLNRKRSDGRLKRYSSCDDLRAWVDDQYLNYQYLLELITDGEFQRRPFLGIMGRIIPVKDIFDVLCRDASYHGEGYEGSRRGKLGPKPEEELGGSAATVAIGTDDILKITNAAMSKLENINGLVQSISDDDINHSCDEKRESDKQISCDIQGIEEDLTSKEEYSVEYNDTLRKISCLRQTLRAIQQRREELNTKVQSSLKARSSSRMTVTELYSREEQVYKKRLQKRLERLINEKGQVLNEMCQALKYMNELKKKFNPRREQSRLKNSYCSEKEEHFKKSSNCPCPYKKNSADSEHKEESDESGVSVVRRERRDAGNTDSRLDFREGYFLDDSAAKLPSCQTNDNQTIYRNNALRDVDSSEALFTSVASIPESQRTYQISQVVPGRKSESEITANELEQTLRNYEHRLSELEFLEIQIKELKKKACLANYFKKRWLRCASRGRAQKAAEKSRMEEEMKQLCVENSDLKKVILKLSSEREQKENEYLKWRQKQVSQMEKEITKLKKQLKDYKVSFDSQRERIGTLENTVTVQRDTIERLTAHIARPCRVTERVRETGKVSKKSLRSRSYGPENKKCPTRPPTTASSEESLQRISCCCCCGCDNNPEESNRPKSESYRRMSMIPQHTWKRQSCKNYACRTLGIVGYNERYRGGIGGVDKQRVKIEQ